MPPSSKYNRPPIGFIFDVLSLHFTMIDDDRLALLSEQQHQWGILFAKERGIVSPKRPKVFLLNKKTLRKETKKFEKR